MRLWTVSIPLSWLQCGEVIPHHIAQAKRDIITFQCPIGGIAVILVNLIVGNRRLSRWILGELTLGDRHAAGIRFKDDILLALPPNPLRSVDGVVLTFTLSIRVVILGDVPGLSATPLVSACAAWCITRASATPFRGWTFTGLLALLPALTLPAFIRLLRLSRLLTALPLLSLLALLTGLSILALLTFLTLLTGLGLTTLTLLLITGRLGLTLLTRLALLPLLLLILSLLALLLVLALLALLPLLLLVLPLLPGLAQLLSRLLDLLGLLA